MNDIAIWKVEEWRYDLDPPKENLENHRQMGEHHRLGTRPVMRLAIRKCSDGDHMIEFCVVGMMNHQPRYMHLTPQEARKLAHALCDMADKFDEETKAA